MYENMSAEAIAAALGMERLPVEGTFYRQTYRSPETLAGGAPAGTAMIGLYSAEPPSFSCFHRLTRREMWHFYCGDPFELLLLHPDGRTERVVMGADFMNGEHIQFDIPSGVWQAGKLLPGGRFAVYGCTLAPGFTPDCFESARAGELLENYPDMAGDIEQLCGGDGEKMPEDCD